MPEVNPLPAELIETMDPAPEDPEPIILARATWLDLIRVGHASDKEFFYIWNAYGVERLAACWIGHPDAWKHFQQIIKFKDDKI